MAMERSDLNVLDKFESDLLETLAVDTLLPHLRKNKLLTSNEIDALTKSGVSRREAATELLRILKTKGSGSFSLFIDALQKEKEHIGHQSLYKAITTYCQAEAAETRGADTETESVTVSSELPQHKLLGEEPLLKPNRIAMVSSTPHSVGTDVGTFSLCSRKSSSSSSITSTPHTSLHSPLHTSRSSNSLHGMLTLLSVQEQLTNLEGHLHSSSKHIIAEIKGLVTVPTAINEGTRRASIDSGEVSKMSIDLEKSIISTTSLQRPIKKSPTCPSLSGMVSEL